MLLRLIKSSWPQLFTMLIMGSLFSCERDDQKGERLAKTYCGSCHAFTRPEMLDKTTWQKFVLPEMAFRMGLPSLVIGKKNFDDLQAVLPTIPKQPMVSLLKADSNGTIFVGSRDKSLLRLQDHFLVKEKYLLDSPPSYLLSHGN